MHTKKVDLVYKVAWIFRFLFAPRKIQYSANLMPMEWHHESNLDNDLSIVFVGDLMGLGKKNLQFDDKLVKWIASPDWFCMNLEGQLTKRSKFPVINQLFYTPQPLEYIRKTLPHSEIVASLANNHSGDIDEDESKRYHSLLSDLGYHVIGTENTPVLTPAAGLSIHAHTFWVNKKKQNVSRIEQLTEPKGQGILFVHFGNEFRLRPNVEQISFEKSLNSNFIALIGHHSHRPSVIECENRLIAWSLGNFSIIHGDFRVRWGQILKIGLKKTNDVWNINSIQWKYVYANPLKDNVVIEMKDNCPFFHLS